LSIINRRGAALLVVLFIVMTITILALGFLSRSDVELACGQNMMLRTQMDYLAESGLQHAKGLILNPQDVGSEYWAGATGQQLAAGSDDYYDVKAVRDDSDRCNYMINCNSYRLKGGQQVGVSSLTAQLRLDPCIALWTGGDTTLWNGFTIEGDFYCDGRLVNAGIINGDVFADKLTGSITGQHKAVADLSLVWPQVKVIHFISNYATKIISSDRLSGVTRGSLDPVGICYRNGSLTLAGNVSIQGMLIVIGDLTVQGDDNIITAAKNLPALFVAGDVRIEGGGSLQVNGLAVLEKRMLVNGNASDISILGGLFVKDIVAETTADSSGEGNTGILYNGPTWQPLGGRTGGALDFDGTNDYVRVDANPALNNLSAITMAAWIYPRIDGYWHVLDKGDGDKRMYAEGSSLRLNGRVRYTGTHAYSESVSNTIMLNKWQHVALTWSKSDNRTRLYRNGVEVTYSIKDIGSGTVLDDTTYPYTIGARGALEAVTFFDGMIDDVRIYNRVLDANDIYPPVDGLPGLMGHWKLDEAGSGPISVTAAPAKTAVVLWSDDGTEKKWGQAAGAFFRSIRRE
jgi:hypothetical protein